MNKKIPVWPVDTSVRPQDDFFHHVNNIWLKENPIPASESRWGVFHVLRDQAWENMRNIYEDLQDAENLKSGSIEQQARDFYYSGMHYTEFTDKHLATFKKYFEQIDSITSSRELSALIGKLHRIGMSGPWVSIVDADDKDSRVHVLRLHQSGLTLPDRDYYLSNEPKMDNIRKKYHQHLSEIAIELPGLSTDSVDFSDVVMAVETKLAENSKTRVELRDAESNYHKTSFKKLKEMFGNIHWDEYAESLGWRTDDKISVDQPEFMAYVNDLIVSLPLEEWKTYLKWKFATPLYGRINESFAELKFDFFGKVLSGTTEVLPLWKRVGSTLDDGLGEGVGRLYAERHFPESSKKQVLEMVENVRSAYAERIADLDWMQADTKAYALQKLAAIKVLIGYPDSWRDYTNLHIVRDSFIDNILAADEFDTLYELEKLQKPTSRDEWFMYPQTVNAYHDPNRLVICFPGAILQPPFFDPNASHEVNYGGIGSVIGHEFTHGFDDQGCEFDAEGNLRQWQSDTDKNAFHERAQLIIEQADKFEVIPGVNLQGKLVIGEAIADLGGVEISLHALKNIYGELTEEQMKQFFIANAAIESGHTREEKQREYALSDPHPAEVFRINATLQHVDAFHETYDTNQEDGMYRESSKRARIW